MDPGGEFVLLGMPDVHGALRGKAVSRSAFDDALENGTVITDLLLALDPLDEPITTYESFGLRTGAGDLRLRPETDRLHDLSWRPGWSVCLATPEWGDGRPCEIASREVLRRALDSAASQGVEAMAAFEYEIRISDADGSPLPSALSYSLTELGLFEALAAQLVPALAGLGVEVTAIHTEPGEGLMELNLAARTGFDAADDAALAKFCVKQLTQSMGLRASFLAKTVPHEEGSSGHAHLSFWRDGANLFAGGNPEELGADLGGAIAGVLDHLAGASALLNPTINSYKRLVPGWFTPVNVSWGYENRSCAVRAIRSEQADRCRFECRRPGADANPYLAMAALVASALDGMQRSLEPPEPVVGDASGQEGLPPLPGSLESAIAAFQADDGLRDALGTEFSDYYVMSREWELAAWRKAVSDWERLRYERAV